MRDNYDFSNARKNPFAGKPKGKFTVIVEHEGYNEVIKYDYTKTPHTREVVETRPIIKDTTDHIKIEESGVVA